MAALSSLCGIGADLGASVDVSTGDMRIPPPWALGACGVGLGTGLGMFMQDFSRKQRQGHEKRQRVFARTVRAYLAEFNAELREQTKAQLAKSFYRTPSNAGLAVTPKFQAPESRSGTVEKLFETSDREAVMGPKFVSFLERGPTASGQAYSMSTFGDELPFVMTHSFCMGVQNKFATSSFTDEGADSVHGLHDSSESKYGFKTIFLVGIEPEPKKLVVRRGASEDDVRAAVLRLFRLQEGQPVSFTSGLDDNPVDSSYDCLVDGGVYRVRQESNVRRRRFTMIAQAAADLNGGFRYSVGVDWREVFNMLRKAIDYGETAAVREELHELLARNLIERLDTFYENPERESYKLGKALDHIDRDLRQLCDITSMSPDQVLRKWRPTTVGGKQAASQLVQHLQRQLRQRNEEGLWNLRQLLYQSYLKKEHLYSNGVSWAMSCTVGTLTPHVHALQCRLAREIGEAKTVEDLPRVSAVLFWTLVCTIGMQVIRQVSRQTHIKQTATTLQELRKKAASLLARADQAFFDTHDVEDILATLETDIGNIELLLRFCRGWLVDLCHVFVSVKMIFNAMTSTSASGALGLAAGAAACGLGSTGIRWLKAKLSDALNYIPEEEDDVQEYIPGARVTYTGSYTKCDITLPTGVVLEIGDAGEVVAQGVKSDAFRCRFGAGEVELHENDLRLDDEIACGTMGGPDPDYDEVWDSETFSVARQWGRDVAEVENALAVKDLQIEQQNKFILIPAILQDVMEAYYDTLPKFAMLLSAMVVCQRMVDITGGGGDEPSWLDVAGSSTIGATLLFLKDEAETAVSLLSKMRSEVKSLVADCFTGARRTLHLLSYRPTIDTRGSQPDPNKISPPPATIEGRLEFKDVGFTYPSIPGKEILSGMSFTIEPGSHVAIVGPSGCGKSTIMSLITRLYDPDEGNILLDGVALSMYDVRFLRRKLVGLAVQDPYLFPGTLQYNVKYAHTEASRTEVQEALRMAAADHIIDRLPEKLLSVVGPGLKLSGGEQKRIGLARALLAAPRVLVLDEPTAGVDASTEAVIKKNLDEYRRQTKCSILTTSHQISFIQDCDKILVVGDPDVEGEKGRVIASGTHDTLLKQCTQYQKLINAAQIRCTQNDQNSVVTNGSTESFSPRDSPSNRSMEAAS